MTFEALKSRRGLSCFFLYNFVTPCFFSYRVTLTERCFVGRLRGKLNLRLQVYQLQAFLFCLFFHHFAGGTRRAIGRRRGRGLPAPVFLLRYDSLVPRRHLLRSALSIFFSTAFRCSFSGSGFDLRFLCRRLTPGVGTPSIESLADHASRVATLQPNLRSRY